MIGIVFATTSEAAPFLSLSPNDLITKSPFELYRMPLDGHEDKQCLVMISTMGKVAACLATSLLICQYHVKHVINAGICGGLNKVVSSGQVYCIDQALEGDLIVFGKRQTPFQCSPWVWPDLPKARLVTCDTPVFDSDRKFELGKMADLVDMEGAAIVRSSSLFQIPCTLIKGVTDLADEGGQTRLKQNLNAMAQTLGDKLFNGLVRDISDRS